MPSDSNGDAEYPARIQHLLMCVIVLSAGAGSGVAATSFVSDGVLFLFWGTVGIIAVIVQYYVEKR